MKQAQIEVGGEYIAKVSNQLVPLLVLRTSEWCDNRGKWRRTWLCRNQRTGRQITVKSAQRFRRSAAVSEQEVEAHAG